MVSTQVACVRQEDYAQEEETTWEDGRRSPGIGLLGPGTTYSTQTSYKEAQWATPRRCGVECFDKHGIVAS